MELTIYDIIKGPIISDKAFKLNRTEKQLVLKVHVLATKPLIRDALEKIFDVKVNQVRTLIRKSSKATVASRRYVAKPTVKKQKIAYVTLAEGHDLNLFEQAGVAPSAGQEAKKTETKKAATS